MVKQKEFHNIGITVSKQWGSAVQSNWQFCIHLSGSYWSAIDRDYRKVKAILDTYSKYRISRMDLARDTVVPLHVWQEFCSSAFNSKICTVNGKADATTIYYRF